MSNQQQLSEWVGGIGNGRVVSGGSIRFDTKFPAQDFLLELNSVRYSGMERVRWSSTEPNAIYITFRPEFTDRNRKIRVALEWRKQMVKYELEIANRQLQQTRLQSETPSGKRKVSKTDRGGIRPPASSSPPAVPASPAKPGPRGIHFSG